MYNILDENPLDNILTRLGSLIGELKDKKSDMKVYVCELVPTLLPQEIQAKILDYNHHFIDWAETVFLSLKPRLTLD